MYYINVLIKNLYLASNLDIFPNFLVIEGVLIIRSIPIFLKNGRFFSKKLTL